MKMIQIFKYWKPTGIISSLNHLESNNILQIGQITSINQQQIFSSSSFSSLLTIGRLDKDSSGLLLLTNSSLLVKELTRTYSLNKNNNIPVTQENKEKNKEDKEDYGSKYEKVYHVKTRNYISNELLQKLRDGVSIKTIGRRKNNPIKSNRKTLPCKIERTYEELYSNNENNKNKVISKNKRTNDLYFILREGRNRQIRKMVGSVGHGVDYLCRLSFGGITLDGLNGPGDILPLTDEEKESLGINFHDLK